MPGDPEKLGGYWLAARLGAGGRGVTYDAYDDDGQRFAVTVPRGEAEPESRGETGRRFGRVTCRHLAEVVDAGVDGGVPYVVSEFVDGPDLRQAVALHGPYDGDELLALAGSLGAALGALHEEKLTHQGINPESVLLAAGGLKVIELGLPAWRPMGETYTYLAPEVLTGQEAGAPADVFAWGAVVVFAATGRDPFRGESLGGIMHRLLTCDPDLSGLPEPLRGLVGRALAKDPADRPVAAELLIAAGDALRPPQGHARPRSLGAVAEDVYQSLTPRQQEEVPGLLLRLLDGDNPHDEGDVLGPLMDAGLLVRRSVRVAPVETSMGKLVALSDDGVAPASAALYRAWPRLRGWAADERDSMHVHRQIRMAATQWSEHRRGRSRLLRGDALDTALGWAATKRRHLRLNQLERDFINDSVALSKQRRKILTPSMATLGVLLAVAVTMSVVSVHGQNDLRGRLLDSDARAVAARAEAMRSTDPRTAMRLSVAAWRMSPVFEARAALQASLVQPELGVFTDPAADLRAGYLLHGDELIRWDTGTVTVFDVPNGRWAASYRLPPGSVALSDDGRYAEGAGGRPFDVVTGRPPSADATFAITSAGRTRVYRGSEVVFDVTDRTVALARDGSRAAFSRLDGRVELWELAPKARTGTIEVQPLTGPDAAAPALSFSPDGSTLAVAGREGVTLVAADRGAARTQRSQFPSPLTTTTAPSSSPSATANPPGSAGKPRPSGGSPPAAGRTPAAGLARPSTGALSGGGGPHPAGRPSSIGQPAKGPGPAVAALPGVNGTPSAESSGAHPTGAAPAGVHASRHAGEDPRPGVVERPGGEDPRFSQVGAPVEDGANRGGADASPSPENGAETFRAEERQAPTKTGTLTLGTVEGTLDGPPVFSPDGRLLALPGAGEVRVWNVAERRVTGSYPLRDPGHGLAFSADGRTLRYLSGTGSVVSLDVAGLPAPSDTGRTATFSGNGRFAAKEVGDTIELTDTVAGRTLGRIAAAGDVSFAAGGRLLAVTGDPVTVWEVAGARQVASIDAGGDVLAVSLSPDGGTLATARGSALETWDVREGRRIKVYEGAADLALAFSPDGSTLAAGANLLDLRTGRITPLALAAQANARTTPTALAFSPDGRTLAFGLDAGRVLLWDVYERVPRGTIGTGTTPVDEVRFSPKGDLLAIDAARTSLWDVNTLREVGEVGSWAAGPAFSQDGRRLRGVALDGTVRETPVDPALTAQEVCARAGGPLSRAEWSRLIPESRYRDIC
ncbi:hypothetical protein [Nonomuraea sp. KC401]|uniref:protein kinase domain-containing protein n=1 Tax=Nonomuraea sp. KC401 TaxID=1848324 RepID=UPI001BB1672E|nr:hypothetical protein [Nonomuraea sp. KC401]